jgi:hypothetical protein
MNEGFWSTSIEVLVRVVGGEEDCWEMWVKNRGSGDDWIWLSGIVRISCCLVP